MNRLSMLCFVSLLSTSSAFAATKICVVDGESALNETAEGKAAQKKLETLYASRQAELQKLQADLEKAVSDFQARAMVLSEDAKRTQQEDLGRKQAELQQRAAAAEAEMQQTYQDLLSGMEAKLDRVAQSVGAAKGCTVLLQKAAVLYSGADVVDLTKDLITALDAK